MPFPVIQSLNDLQNDVLMIPLSKSFGRRGPLWNRAIKGGSGRKSRRKGVKTNERTEDRCKSLDEILDRASESPDPGRLMSNSFYPV